MLRCPDHEIKCILGAPCARDGIVPMKKATGCIIYTQSRHRPIAASSSGCREPQSISPCMLLQSSLQQLLGDACLPETPEPRRHPPAYLHLYNYTHLESDPIPSPVPNPVLNPTCGASRPSSAARPAAAGWPARQRRASALRRERLPSDAQENATAGPSNRKSSC